MEAQGPVGLWQTHCSSPREDFRAYREESVCQGINSLKRQDESIRVAIGLALR